MIFEFDPRKSLTNKLKHGIDFEEAKRLWKDDRRVDAPVRVTGEPRWISVGVIGGTYWTAVWTKRSEAIRIISVRRARRDEVGGYHSRRLR
jgi:uncharacterized DUF497 family protein